MDDDCIERDSASPHGLHAAGEEMMPETREWLALCRVHAGGLIRLGENYLNFGQRVPTYLAVAIDELIDRGLLAVGRPDPIGQRWVCVDPHRPGPIRATVFSPRRDWWVMTADGPDVAAAKRLLDDLKAAGFRFERTAPGEDGPLLGRRVTDRWIDHAYLEGFSCDCLAWRQRRSVLVIPGQGMTERRVSGGALSVLAEVATWEKDS